MVNTSTHIFCYWQDRQQLREVDGVAPRLRSGWGRPPRQSNLCADIILPTALNGYLRAFSGAYRKLCQDSCHIWLPAGVGLCMPYLKCLGRILLFICHKCLLVMYEWLVGAFIRSLHATLLWLPLSVLLCSLWALDRTLSIHLNVGLPRGLFPPTYIVVISFATFLSSLLITWPYHERCFWVSDISAGDWLDHCIAPGLFVSNSIFSCFALNPSRPSLSIFISVVCILCCSALCSAQHSLPYVNFIQL